MAAALLAVGAARASPSPAPHTVTCDEPITYLEFPYPGRSLVLGVVSVPQLHLPQIIRSGQRKWPYWMKAPLFVAGRAAVTVTVARPFRNRVAFEWGLSDRIVSSLRIAGCPEPADAKTRGRVYTGGFYRRPRSVCVPIVFHVGDRTETVRFGLGKRCP